MRRDWLTYIRPLLPKEGRSFVLIMSALVIIAPLLAAYLPLQQPYGIMGLLALSFTGAISLALLAMRASPEWYVGVAAITTACLTSRSVIPLINEFYVFLPGLVITLYRKISTDPSKKDWLDKGKISIFHGLVPILVLMTILISWVWPEILLKSLIDKEHPLFSLSSYIPSSIALTWGAWLALGLTCFSTYLGYPTFHYPFSPTVFDYWWIVICQIGVLFSPQSMRNLLVVSFLPFLFKGIIDAYIRLRAYKIRTPIILLMGAISILLGFPLILLTLYTLFQPWVKWKTNKKQTNRRTDDGKN